MRLLIFPNTDQNLSCYSDLKPLSQCLKAWSHKLSLHLSYLWMPPQTKPVPLTREGRLCFLELKVFICTCSRNKLHLIVILVLRATQFSPHQLSIVQSILLIQKSVPSFISQIEDLSRQSGSFCFKLWDDVLMSRNNAQMMKIQSILIWYI